MNNYIVYILLNNYNNKTYVGITNNSIRRIRQHNGELVGGARYTKMNKENGLWEYYCHLTGFTKSEALSLEKRIKLKSVKMSKKYLPIERRIRAVIALGYLLVIHFIA